MLVEIVFGWFDAAIKVKKTIDESKDNINKRINGHISKQLKEHINRQQRNKKGKQKADLLNTSQLTY